MFRFSEYQPEFDGICQKYGVKKLIAFGSSISDNFTDDSDIDFLLELNDVNRGLFRYMRIKFELEKLFDRSVDLVMPKAIKNQRIKTHIFSQIKEIYAAWSFSLRREIIGFRNVIAHG